MDTPKAAVLAYFDAVNKGDADAAADTFTADGAMMAHQVQTLTGREVIRGALGTCGAWPPTRRSR